jgi:hypothetical protein
MARLRVDRPGRYRIHGVRVWYRAGLELPLLGRGHYVQSTGTNVELNISNP